MIREYMKKIHRIACKSGWWDKKKLEILPRHETAPRYISLVYSELGECIEGMRVDNWSTEPKSGGVGEELADTVIRIFDFCEAYEIDLHKAIEDKMLFNETRDFKHGNKLF